ncbi:hypothetical protein BDN72DRAFT_784471 [Pluteus cervinus]|uniref:Uncharacterized protein n=1 Tax=Pluteus cervinus TaxID=181527 RepID=A0ACD3BHW8_9AGAR|nr:hypothetical protein BDN72DRAFT_784471 [Pluteus cervinus]
MTDKIAKSHTHTSNRVKHPDAERKVTFKGVLDNALRIQWPSVPVNIQNVALACLVSHLDGVAHYRSSVKRGTKRKLDQSNGSDGAKRQRIEAESQVNDDRNATRDIEQAPVVTQHMVIGVNEVTKRLEQQIRDTRNTINLSSMDTNPPDHDPLPILKVVFACRADVNPTVLLDHLPHLVAAFNSIRSSPSCLLVPLPRGAEVTLSETLGIRRAAVIGLNADFPDLSSTLSQLEAIPKLTASWLYVDQHTQLMPTHIKQLRTSAPKDMKSSKERRVKERAVAKAKAKEKGSLPRESSQHVA